MAKTATSIKKVPAGCVRTVNIYAQLIYGAEERGQQLLGDETRKKLRGYLTCLKDLGLITESELKTIYLWVITGHLVGEKEGKIGD